MKRLNVIAIGLCGTLATVSPANAQKVQQASYAVPSAADKAQAITKLTSTYPRVDFRFLGNRIERVLGQPFSSGKSAEASAESFKTNYANVFGIASEDLVPGGPFEDGRVIQPIMYIPETGQFKFMGVYYRQVRDGVPVFRSQLMLLVRNEPGFPLVQATADVRDIGNFRVGVNAVVQPHVTLAAVRQIAGKDVAIEGPTTVIWAGVDDIAATPTLAHQYIASGIDAITGFPTRMLYLVDAGTGALLYSENQIHDIDVSGNVSGNATTGYAAWQCGPQALTGIPYAKVNIGATTAYADVNGNYTIVNLGSSPVNVTASLAGPYFTTRNSSSGNSTASITNSVTPPGPGDFVFNTAQNEQTTAEVNAYVHANIVRDYALTYNPAYPSVATQTNFPVNVNINLTCNAFYSASTINFYVSGGGCANTGFSSVVYHEYGHNLVEKAGSGQGAYGEGSGDVMSVLISDSSCLGDGFQGCGVCLRNANNTCQYQTSGCSTCGSLSHDCGRLISGCVWSLRNNLLASHPATYRQILSNLAINAMFLHGSSSSITPSITTDYLTLDDDDAELSNGTPHYSQINSAFAAHNMAGPALSSIFITFPNGKPQYVSPSGGTTMRVVVNANTATPQPGSAKLVVNTGSGFVQLAMNQISPNVYDAVFPASACGTNVTYYVTAQTTTSQTVSVPSNAPTGVYSAISASGPGPTLFADDFNTNLGWTVTNSAGLTGGGWERAIPRTDCSRSNPLSDADGSGWCFLTQNSNGPAGDACNSDIDGGTTTLTSPNMNAVGTSPVLSYWRWYDNLHPSNTNQDDPFVVEFSINGGASWQNLETVGPTGPGTDGGWVLKQFNLNSVPGFSPTNQFRVRFTAQDLGVASVVEAAVDGVMIQTLNCANPCPADINGDQSVNVSDLLAVINGWGPCSGACPPSCTPDINHDCSVNVSDLLAVINGWGSCP